MFRCTHCVFLQGHCTSSSIGLALDICLSYGVYSSLEEAFEFCWSLFAGEVKLNKFEFGTQGLLDLLCKH